MSDLKKLYVTFGQSHAHRINGETLDCNCVAVIFAPTCAEADALAFEWFDGKFHQHVCEDQWNPEVMKYFPRGYILVNPPLEVEE